MTDRNSFIQNKKSNTMWDKDLDEVMNKSFKKVCTSIHFLI